MSRWTDATSPEFGRGPRLFDIEVYRDGRWWMIAIPEIDGLTQTEHLALVGETARSYIATDQDLPLDDVEVKWTGGTVHPLLSTQEGIE